MNSDLKEMAEAMTRAALLQVKIGLDEFSPEHLASIGYQRIQPNVELPEMDPIIRARILSNKFGRGWNFHSPEVFRVVDAAWEDARRMLGAQ